ncbi:hypothetical protein G6F29_012155 [Rhizopus arrhizus]|nr:hypothetical protein G6F24_011829 [Rhizopus arrhizus]KAG0929856.1 hypothetical protein G6F30_011860 [Rhizopus arrhizus]KAG0974522.1 hypothetical protein G6F29_012155 [Rhizopus arrhizus]KAG0979772.1 hypothetical protein G6F28_011822 [Rhizopus arrhizus]KAG1031889.1 hypothetical protein G6F25_011746 [Rhizopus arrhizus]
MPKRLPEEKVNDLKQALTGSTSTYDIAKETGVHQSTVKCVNDHQDWTVEEWRKVVFSDETKINVWGSDGCKYYWKRPSDPLQPHHLEFTVKHGGGKLMMWGCIISKEPGYACQMYDGNMNADVYQHILDTTLRDTMEYYNFNWSNIYFQHDNDPKHKAKSTITWLDNHQNMYGIN